MGRVLVGAFRHISPFLIRHGLRRATFPRGKVFFRRNDTERVRAVTILDALAHALSGGTAADSKIVNYTFPLFRLIQWAGGIIGLGFIGDGADGFAFDAVFGIVAK